MDQFLGPQLEQLQVLMNEYYPGDENSGHSNDVVYYDPDYVYETRRPFQDRYLSTGAEEDGALVGVEERPESPSVSGWETASPLLPPPTPDMAHPPGGGRPILVLGPKDSFVVRNRPATLTCRALYASRIRFKCNGQWVESYFGLDGYQCQCFASASKEEDESVRSDRVSIRVAFMRKHFYTTPAGERQPVGTTIRLPCLPPEGDPKPHIFWLRDGEEIRRGDDSNIILANDGSLILSAARTEDSGNYTCGARNVATKRLAPTARLHIYVDGDWASWSSWAGSCDVDCARLEAENLALPRQSRHRLCSAPAPQNGGADCPGPSDESRDCPSACLVHGGWTDWTHWSDCSSSCQQYRRRDCAEPLPSNGGRTCAGEGLITRPCPPTLCTPTSTHERDLPGSLGSGGSEGGGWEANVAMYAGLSVAGLLFVSLIALLLWLFCRRRRQNKKDDIYYSASPGNLRTVLKAQPDLTAAAIMRQEDLCGQKLLQLQGRASSQGQAGGEFSSFSLRSGKSGSSGSGYGQARLLREGNRRNLGLLSGSNAALLEGTSSNGSSSQPASIDSGERVRRAERSRSRDSANSDENYATLYDFESTPAHKAHPTHTHRGSSVPGSRVEVESLSVAMMGAAGGRLSLPGTGISLTVPEGALGPGQREEVYLALCRDPRDRPPLTDNETLLSPVVWAGPAGLAWRKPVVLSLPHSAHLFPGQHWALSLLLNPGLPGEEEPWQRLLTLGEENINSPVYAQLDLDSVHVMTESLGRLVLSGQRARPDLPPPVKRLRLAAFAPRFPSALDAALRVYALDDLPSSLQAVEDEEEAGGGVRVGEDRQLLAAEDGDLAFCLEDIAGGWQVKPGSAYQEIPSRHLWSATAGLHCSFSLESAAPAPRPLSARVVVYQKGHPHARQLLAVNAASATERVSSRSGDSGVQTIVSGRSSAGSSGPYAVSALKGSPGGSPPARPPAFALPLGVKRRIAGALDPPQEDETDWRMLARQLGVDGYIQFFGFRPSPTEHILDLWEARAGGSSGALGQLLAALKGMGRPDAAAPLDAFLGTSPMPV